jgi:phytanoyl-CoA hydroxylase
MPGTTTTITTTDISGGIKVADGDLSPDRFGFLRPSNLSLPIETLRERFKEDNYLFLKGLLPREHALKARDAYFRFLSSSNILRPGTSAVDGIFDLDNELSNFGGLSSRQADMHKPRREQAATFTDLTARAHTEKWYTSDFCQHPDLINFVARLTQWKDVRQFERSLLRCNIPNSSPIGVHYDQIFLRKGDITNITAWCVMGDIKVHGGGLMYLEKSKCEIIWMLS